MHGVPQECCPLGSLTGPLISELSCLAGPVSVEESGMAEMLRLQSPGTVLRSGTNSVSGACQLPPAVLNSPYEHSDRYRKRGDVAASIAATVAAGVVAIGGGDKPGAGAEAARRS